MSATRTEPGDAWKPVRMPHPAIGTLNEQSLHAALRRWYARPGDRFEVPVDGYVVDIVRGDLLIEVQTRGFSGIKRKMLDLAARRLVRLVHPIVGEKWVVRLRRDGSRTRRKSPKRGCIEMLFDELVSFPGLLAEPGFSLEVLVVEAEDLRGQPAGGRRRYEPLDRRLLRVVGQRLFQRPADLAALLPDRLVEPFATVDLAAELDGGPRRPLRLAQRMAFCLRELGLVEAVGKRGNAVLYVRAAAPQRPRVTIVGSEPLH